MTLRQSSVRKVRDLDGVDSYEHLGNNTGVNILNTSAPPLDDVRVRQAVARAIDQDAVIDVLGGTGLTPRSTQLFSEDDPRTGPRRSPRPGPPTTPRPPRN